MARKPRAAKAQPQRFDKRLVLNRFMLAQLGAKDFYELRAYINRPENEGINEAGADAGVSNFCLAISEFARMKNAPLRGGDRDSILQIYDQNIQKWTKELNAKRGSAPIRWKYFQYLALLFTEIYLDCFMNGWEAFLQELNEYVRRFNAKLAALDVSQNTATPPIEAYRADDLRKLALWCATGSGKTLIMQMNIKQYLHYAQKADRKEEINCLLLITPYAGLSEQHKAEFKTSGIWARLFGEKETLLNRGEGKPVEIIENTKLDETSGEKIVAVEAFEGNNLVLVDEGHRGTQGGKGKGEGAWRTYRRALAAKGFTFEYSATLGQAVSGNAALVQEYAKSILMDYSYRYFYRDGYGKQYLILNFAEKAKQDMEDRALYLTACLLKFYQQKILFKDGKAEAKKFQIENPLMVFVGGSVTKALPKKDASDIVDIVQFFAEFAALANKAKVLRRLSRLLGHDGAVGLLDSDGRDIFRGAYAELAMRPAEEIYDGILGAIFNAAAGAGGSLHIQEIKSADGEISLSLGAAAKPFGVINVGDSAGLAKLFDGQESKNIIRDAPNAFGGSLFAELNAAQSKTNILIGSKKFTEGWNSYRVATMGLMNVGKNEGSQIIQLFGRGVRLKGYGNSLQRHSALIGEAEGIGYNGRLEQLETLNVFGINAEYMDRFKAYLKDEGVAAAAKKSIELPVIPNLSTDRLKIIALKDGLDFKRSGERPKLEKTAALAAKARISIDYYPRLQAHFRNAATKAQRAFQPIAYCVFGYGRFMVRLAGFQKRKGLV